MNTHTSQQPPDHTNPDDSYLWSGTGTPDPLVVSLEESLSSHKLAKHELGDAPPQRASTWRRTRWFIWSGSMAAAIVLAWITLYWGAPRHPSSIWTLSPGNGVADISTVAPSTVDGESGRLVRTISTAPASFTTASIADAATVRIEASSTVRLFEPLQPLDKSTSSTAPTSGTELELAEGSVYIGTNEHGPGIGVRTPSGSATMHIQPGSAALIRIPAGDASSSGGIELKNGMIGIALPSFASTESRFRLAPGMSCPITRTSKGITIGTPRPAAASEMLSAALAFFDSQMEAPNSDPATRRDSLGKVLAIAGPHEDRLLWNLMHRTDEAGRKQIIGYLRTRSKSIGSLDDDALIRLDPDEMNAWWR